MIDRETGRRLVGVCYASFRATYLKCWENKRSLSGLDVMTHIADCYGQEAPQQYSSRGPQQYSSRGPVVGQQYHVPGMYTVVAEIWNRYLGLRRSIVVRSLTT